MLHRGNRSVHLVLPVSLARSTAHRKCPLTSTNLVDEGPPGWHGVTSLEGMAPVLELLDAD